MFLLRYLVILAIPVLAYIGLRKLAIRYSLNQRQFNLLLILATVLIGIVILILLGRIPVSFILAPIMVAITFLFRNVHLLLRLLPLWQMFKGKTRTAYGASGGEESSSINTRFLKMSLQHDSGDMDGEVLEGEFKGAKLSAMAIDELLELAQECHRDADSLQVLEAYLDRSHAQWRANAGAQQGQASSSGVSETVLDRGTALDILGLQQDATQDDIVQAHRRLMQKMHPDRGGSDYLAKKINAARDFLLGQR